MRIAIAKYGQETSSFSPVMTTLETFEQFGIFEGQDVLETSRGVGTIGGFLNVAESAGMAWTPLALFRAWAGASGIITAETLQYFEEKLVAGLEQALPVDAFYFDLHGAGQAEHVPDTEGYLLHKARQILGPDVPIVIALDHHANLTPLMFDSCDALVAHRTQPHEPYETGQLAARILFSILKGNVKPTMAWRKIPLITHQEQFLTTKPGPMQVWFDLAREMETRPGVVSASTFPMQPWLDVPEGGWAAVAVTNNDPPLADELATELADKAWNLREQFWRFDSIPAEDAVRKAVAADQGLVVISDTGDSVFGGGTGDSTCLLKVMLELGIQQPALLPMVDSEVVETAIAAGQDAEITVNIGGKLDNRYCQPVEINARVLGIGGGRIHARVIGMESFDMGRAVLLEVGNIRIVASERRGIGGNHPVVYEHFGVNPTDAKMVVLKTASNWQYYSEMTSEVIRANTPGMTMSNLQDFEWKLLPRPIYPLDDIAEWSAVS